MRGGWWTCLLSVLLALLACGLVSPSRWHNVLFVSTIGAKSRCELRGISGTRLMGRKRSGGGGKHKGNKGKEEGQERDTASNGEDEDAFSLAPRVSSNINIPVRRQIAFAKQIKKMVAEEAKPAPPPKKVRIKKKDEGQKLGISSDYAPFSPLQASTILLVDGYNVINNWSKTIKARSAGGMPQARQALLEQLRFIYHARGWKIIVAYDEHKPGSELRVLEGDVDEVYTGERESADSFIEKKAVELSKRRPAPTVTIATDDRAIQVVSATTGATIMSTSSLIKDIYVARKELIHRRTEWKDGERQLEDADDYFSYKWDGVKKISYGQSF